MSKDSLVRTLALTTVIFLAIAILGISFLFTGAEIVSKDASYAYNGLSTYGMTMRLEAWYTYPDYNIGMGVIAFAAFIGVCVSASVMLKVYENETV